MNLVSRTICLVAMLTWMAPSLHAQPNQNDQVSDSNEVESLYDSIDQEEESQKKRPPKSRTEAAPKQVKSLTDLGTLEPFSDIAVISRKFLPKTKRLELSGSVIAGLNNAFFDNFGGAARVAYYFREKYGVEAMYFGLSDSERNITVNLRDDRNIDTKSLVVPQNFIGLSFKWVPVYGKMAWLNRKIVPFDLYFSPGIGTTTTAIGNSETTYHLGVGQMFAVSKSFAIRWDFSWNFYQASAKRTINGEQQDITEQQSDLFIALGFSFFVPGAKYR